ncbi:Hypothetical protein CAP_8206 [Chondromyces apiculatus DSM 436]|uniref:Uncharacterized protein n=1 Tax=Chondromyces apiculatus DSM 436 TaxID=1192034 RepID=A0A017TFV5_9BACT|nr:Hypothetical protein CAP_8206 [Chondromyces apiculatus DSM 436]
MAEPCGAVLCNRDFIVGSANGARLPSCAMAGIALRRKLMSGATKAGRQAP